MDDNDSKPSLVGVAFLVTISLISSGLLALVLWGPPAQPAFLNPALVSLYDLLNNTLGRKSTFVLFLLPFIGIWAIGYYIRYQIRSRRRSSH